VTPDERGELVAAVLLPLRHLSMDDAASILVRALTVFMDVREDVPERLRDVVTWGQAVTFAPLNDRDE
jgi:hypothetical protein